MNSVLNLLIVEDRDCHFRDFMAILSSIENKLPIELNVSRATTLTEAENSLQGADAVLCDLFFPDAPGGEEQGNGQKVAEQCLAENRPVVWITSTYHHGAKTEPFNIWAREHGVALCDCDLSSLPETENPEAEHKPWREALFAVIALTIGVELGEYRVNDMQIQELDGFRDSWEKLGRSVIAVGSSIASPQDRVTLRMLQMGFARIHEQ